MSLPLPSHRPRRPAGPRPRRRHGHGADRHLLQLPDRVGRLGHAAASAIKAKTGITVPPDNKNSGQSLAQLVAEKASPVADVTYLGVTFAIQAQKDGVVAAVQAGRWNDIPDGLKDPDGPLVHHPLGHARLHGQRRRAEAASRCRSPGPTCSKPEYKGLVGYLDPASAFVGYVGAVAVNQARGGTLDNFDTGHRLLQGAAEERAHRAEADLVCARAVGRDRDPARLRLQRLPRASTRTRPTSRS